MAQRDRANLVIGSVGLGVALVGVALFLEQLYRGISSGKLENVPVRAALDDPLLRTNIFTEVSVWFRWLTSLVGAEPLAEWIINESPLALFLVVVGGLVTWRSLRSEARASRSR